MAVMRLTLGGPEVPTWNLLRFPSNGTNAHVARAHLYKDTGMENGGRRHSLTIATFDAAELGTLTGIAQTIPDTNQILRGPTHSGFHLGTKRLPSDRRRHLGGIFGWIDCGFQFSLGLGAHRTPPRHQPLLGITGPVPGVPTTDGGTEKIVLADATYLVAAQANLLLTLNSHCGERRFERYLWS